MSKPRPPARYLRVDWHTNEKLYGLSLLARDILQQAILHCRSGLMQRSVAMMAAAAGKAIPTGQNVQVYDVRLAIAELQRRGLVVWWSHLETLWVIEACDEQRPNTTQWKSIRKKVAAMPPQVRDAFMLRYPYPQEGELDDPRPPQDMERPVFVQAIEDDETPQPIDVSPPPAPTPRAVVPVAKPYPTAPVLQNPPAIRVRETSPAKVEAAGDGGKMGPFLLEWRSRLQELKRELKMELPDSRGPQLFDVLEAYGWQTTWKVLEFTCREVAAKKCKPAWLSRIFHGSGFEARHQAWSEAKSNPHSQLRCTSAELEELLSQ